VRLYRHVIGECPAFEDCFYIDFLSAPNTQQTALMRWLLTEPLTTVSEESCFGDLDVVEIGPRLSAETPFSSNAVAICVSMGLSVRRIERSVRYCYGDGLGISRTPNRDEVLQQHLDRMRETVYPSTLTTFDSCLKPEPVSFVQLLEGEDALRDANKKLGLGMDDWDIVYYRKLFQRLGRNPTDVELFQIGNANSEHSRHWFFRGIQAIDGKEMPESLMDVVREPWQRSAGNSITAFKDNAGVIRGVEVLAFAPTKQGQPSPFGTVEVLQHITATAETHNHPTLIAPFPGAETGTGGRIRDNRAVGRGGLVHAGLAGYSVGNLHIPGFEIPGEAARGEDSRSAATPLEILIRGSDGISDYGNKIGEPLIGGFTRSFGQMFNRERREFRKPVLYSAGFGRIRDMHVAKQQPERGMLIVRIGGPAYRIGVGGGSASSMIHGHQDEELDFKSVQRGNAEMENRANRVIQACAEMGTVNPIESIHDQGAGGPSNVLTELMEPAGGTVDIRKIIVGDTTMSVLEIWVAEYQEGYGLLVRPENIEVFQSICTRERVNCEVLGLITGDGTVVVEDSADGTTPVNLSLKEILGELPRKRFESNRPHVALQSLVIPEGLTVDEALRLVFLLPHVGSKGFLVRKVDRSVTGLVARQQCCGPTQVPVADAAVTADGYFGFTGAASALGEAPIKMLIDPKKGARMAVAEMLTNLASVRITTLSDVKCRANWMWAAKQPGEGALLYEAAVAMRDFMVRLGIASDGGKDSLSMETVVGKSLVISPGELVVMGYAPVPDVRKVVTPDFKGSGCLGYVNLSGSYSRLGGSALAEVLGQVGDETPDVDASYLAAAFAAVQELIEKGLITAYHDVSDGGLITAVTEMCMAGNRGARLQCKEGIDPLSVLFCEEAGMLFEFEAKSEGAITRVTHTHGVHYDQIGTVGSSPGGSLHIERGRTTLLDRSVVDLRKWWEATSTALEKLQANRETVEAESRSHGEVRTVEYHLSFIPKARSVRTTHRPKVAILREEGTNGDREMAAACFTVGFEPWDITMSDLFDGRVTTLDTMRGVIFPGGFSFADVFGSAKGWAGPIRFNPSVSEIFDRFYDRPDTFSLGVCNGCQLMANIGWLPWKGISEDAQPRFVHNTSGRFESRWAAVKVLPSPSILMRGMEDSVLGIHVAHGEGRMLFPDPRIMGEIRERQLVPLVYVDVEGKATEEYPYDPNGSPLGWTALSSPDGRHLAMMPHPERSFLTWQWPWMPEKWRTTLKASPWLEMFQNACDWCSKG
ncbi:MAG: phosphoribosylformylglycinamidine synthase, partial [Patescibacteria group bacterium]|nr:phosphoribosylformylglycinamidine synthase [Patescibacteria group bacterium]